jgi:hypothetical protein
MIPNRFITIHEQGILRQSAIVCDEIALQRVPILNAERSESADASDSGWQFLCGQSHNAHSAKIWALREVLEYDPSLIPHIELSPGTVLSRKGVTDSWQISMNGTKIHFRLHQDENGYPPVTIESVWALKAEPEGYFLDNIPFFEREATLGDLVSAKESEGIFWFERILKPSANSLLRAMFFDKGRINEIRHGLSNMGCESEAYPDQNLITINLPPSQSLKAVQEYLRAAADQGWLDYEEPILRHKASN